MTAPLPKRRRPTQSPKAAAMPYYDFHSPNPKGGFCEQQTFGRGRLLAEPINVVFSIPTVILGLIGLFRSKRTAMAFQFLYGLLASYGGVCRALSRDAAERLLPHAGRGGQHGAVVRDHPARSRALPLSRQTARPRQDHGYRIVAVLMTLVFTAYPADRSRGRRIQRRPLGGVARVRSPVDPGWGAVAADLAPPRDVAGGIEGARAFRLVVYAMASAFLAYVGWSLDRFCCRPIVAMLCLHGWWDLCMGLCFYYLISLTRFLSAHEYGFEPVVERIAGPLHLPFVEWKSRLRAPSELSNPEAARLGRP